MALKDIIINKSGLFGAYGGRFVPEILVPVMDELNDAFFSAIDDAEFINEYTSMLHSFVGRKSPLVHLKNLSKNLGGAQIYLKNEGQNHTGAHKINHVIGQFLLAKRMGKKRIIAETGAGQHGLATATVAAKLGIPATIYMGEVDYLRQRPNVFWMEMLGATVIPVTSGERTLQSAITAAFKDLISDPENAYYLLGTACGPRPYPSMNVFFQKVIGEEIREQLSFTPDILVASVGGGSNSLGMFYEFLDDDVTLIGVEAGGKGLASNQHAARIPKGKQGIFEGFQSYFLFDEQGNISGTHSISAGLDYSGISPQLAYLNDIERVQFQYATDESVLNAVQLLARTEGIIPALESAHAISQVIQLAPTLGSSKTIVVNCSGRGEKDLFITMPRIQPDQYAEFISREMEQLNEK